MFTLILCVTFFIGGMLLARLDYNKRLDQVSEEYNNKIKEVISKYEYREKQLLSKTIYK